MAADPGQPAPPTPEIEPAPEPPEIAPGGPEEAPPTPMPVQPADDRPYS